MLTDNQKKYLAKIPASLKANIQSHDPKAKKTGEQVVKKIKNSLPNIKILFMGATALGIAGQNDIDIYVLSKRKEFENYLPVLIKLFGEPKKKNESFIEWNFTKNNYHIELYLTEPPKEQTKVFKILKSNKKLLDEYENVKLKYNNKSMRGYQKAKYEFYNKILQTEPNNIVSQSED